MTMPEGYLVHDGGECPVDLEQFVDCIIRTLPPNDTVPLLGHSGVMRAKLQEWRDSEHADGIGAVVGYRPAERSEEVDVMVRWAEDD